MGYDVNRVRLLATMARRRARRRRRLVPVSVLPGQLERRAVERPGPDGGGAGDLRALGPGALPVRFAAVRRAPTALGPALQSVGITSGYYLFNAAPYALTLFIMVLSSSAKRTSVDQPAELVVAR